MLDTGSGWLFDGLRFVSFVLLGVLGIKVIAFVTLSYRHERWLDVVSCPVLTYKPLVSVIVPCYNEEAVIGNCIESLLATYYADIEILIVDDTSSDNTGVIAKRLAAADSRVQVFQIPRGGKAVALNYGLNQARGEIVVTIDADSALQPNTIPYLIAPFADLRVGAVGGNVRVANRRRLLPRQQALEYAMGLNLQRRTFAALGCMQVISGTAGAFRRRVLMQVGGFSPDTTVEDMDVTVAIAAAGYRVGFTALAITYTEAPRSLYDWTRQRYRWIFGGFQVLWKYRRMVFRPSCGRMGMIGLPFYLVFPWVDVLVSILLFLSVGWAIADGSIVWLAQIYLVLATIHVGLAIFAFWLDGAESMWLAAMAAIDSLWYTPLLSFVTVWAGASFVLRRTPRWVKLTRHGENGISIAPDLFIDLTSDGVVEELIPAARVA